MQGLKRVNLLTGFNNSGKSSLLEAIEILASGGEPECFFRISTRRSEFITADEGNASSFGDPTHFFFNRRMGRRDRMAIRSNHWWVSLMLDAPIEGRRSLLVKRSADSQADGQVLIKLTDHGGFDQSNTRFGWGNLPEESGFCPVEYLGTTPSERRVGQLWDQLLLSGDEANPASALRILDDRVNSVAMLVSGHQANRLFVGLKNEKLRTPIGSHGEGMRRLLNIAIAISTVKGGVLLVDEIDTGLHYSVLADMWKLVIGTAIKNDIQVFATTHSLDCLRGLNEACQANPEYAQEISLQTIDRKLPQSIDTDAEGLAASLAIGVEVR